MEQGKQPGGPATPLPRASASEGFERGRYQWDSFVNSVLTDTALSELKKHSTNGCLLCSLDALDGEEWE